jgi:hypothetical protein
MLVDIVGYAAAVVGDVLGDRGELGMGEVLG